VPCFTGRYDPAIGVYLEVVLVPRGIAPYSFGIDASDMFPGGIVRPFKAQIDTGAQTTCITKRVIDHYKMQPNGRTEIISVSGHTDVNTYIFTVGFLMGAVPNRVGSAQTGHFSFFPPIIGAEIFTHDDDDLEVLIGMDIISKGSLHIEGSGFFSFWF
jgi:hypothetical protein